MCINRGGGGGGGGGESTSAAQFNYEIDEMESGTRYANRNIPGATMLSEREQRQLEQMGKKPTFKERVAKEKSAAIKKAAWEFPKNPKVGDIVKNELGTKLIWRGGYWDNLRYGEK